jgi:DNA-binding transcriptional LysR family regulator
VAFAAQLPDLMLHAVRNTIGVAVLPRFFIQAMLDSGEIEEVLPAHPIAAKALFLVRAHGTSGTSRRVSIFVDSLIAQLSAQPGFRLTAALPEGRTAA